MESIKVIGIGPGDMGYLLPVARKAVEDADVLIGGKRALNLFNYLKKEELKIRADLEKVINFIQQNREKKIAVLVSGDPGLYSLLDYLLEHFSSEEIEVIPGLSSVQLAFARAKMSWQDALILSLHGKKEDLLHDLVLPAVKNCAKVALLTDSNNTPQRVAACLLQNGVGQKKMLIGENLSYPEEKFVIVNLKEASLLEGAFTNCVVLIVDR